MHKRDYKLALQTLQAQRLRREHADLAAQPQYRALGEFFFTEMYGPRDFTHRDEQARRLRQFVNIVPGLALKDVEPALMMLDLTNRLDDEMVDKLIEMGEPVDFDEAAYERAYRLVDNYAVRQEQLELMRTALYDVYRTARKAFIGTTLDRTEGLAHMTGMSEIHRFLKHGHHAIQTVKDIYHFVETIYVREKDRLDRIYDEAAVS